MGFNYINCMFHDKEKDLLYTVAFGDEEERKQEIKKMLKETKNETQWYLLKTLNLYKCVYIYVYS